MQPTRTRFLTLPQPSFTRLLAVNPSIHVHTGHSRRNHNSSSSAPSQFTGSAKLFADAAKELEESDASKSIPSRLSILEQEHENWTGDENIKDAVLRMLMDKYKPLRTGTIQTAEQKLKQAPPKLASAAILLNDSHSSATVKLVPTSGAWAAEPLLPSSEGHQPWHTQFKAPSFEVSSVKLARLPPPVVSTRPGSGASPPVDDRGRRLEKEKRKRIEQADRLTEAKESTLEYRMGITIRGPRRPVARLNPVSVKGWTSLIEDQIEKARKAGLFDTVKGRGQPLSLSTEAHNPFIAREEFLMNRIVQRNGAAPPWVEIQIELVTAVNTFRELLRQSWIRRAMRKLCMEHPPELLHRLSLQDIRDHRDPEWIAKEKSYHETAVEQLNSLVRKYNGLAPYAVRRSYYIRDVEVNKLYNDCAADILQQIAERAEGASSPLGGHTSENIRHTTGSELEGRLGIAGKMTFMTWLRFLLRRWFGGRT